MATLFLILAALVGFQTPAADTASLRGTVVHMQNGDPIGRAVVELRQGLEILPVLAPSGEVIPDGAAITQADGSFIMTDLEPGEYSLRVSRNGFVSVVYGRWPVRGRAAGIAGDDAEIVLMPGQVMDLPIALEPASTITGRVYGERGQLLPTVRIDAFPAQAIEEDPSATGFPMASALTDDRGEYRLYWLSPGAYVISAQVSNTMTAYSIDNLVTSSGTETVFYPGVAESNAADPVLLSPGENVSGIDLTLNEAFRFVPTSSTDTESGASIDGVVTRASTGEPLAGVLIELKPAGEIDSPRSRVGVARLSAATDAQGRFALFGVAEGEYRLVTSLSGFVRHEYGQRRPGAGGSTLDVSAQDRLDVAIEMTPAGTVAGRVFDSNGEPLPGVAVQAYQPRYGPDGTRTLDVIQNSVTDDRGEYRLFWLTPGRYLIVADRAGPLAGAAHFRATNVAPHSIFAPTYYPGTPIELEASAVTVFPGDIGGRMDFEVTPAEAVRVSGRVVSSIPGVGVDAFGPIRMLSLTRVGSGVPVRAGGFFIRGDDEGRFELRDVLPGTYRLDALFEVDNVRLSGALIVNVGPDSIGDLEVRIEPGVRVPVRVFVEGVTGDISRIPEDLLFGPFRVRLRASDGRSVIARSYELPADVVFGDIARGSYRVDLTGLDTDYYLKSTRFDDVEISGDTFEVVSGGAALDILISARGARLSGVASNADGRGMPGVQIVLVPDQPRRGQGRFYRTAVSGVDGRFDLESIAPGAYRLFAWDNLEAFEYYDPAFLGRFELRGLPFTLEEDEDRGVDVEILPVF